jgi:hypothetical protein
LQKEHRELREALKQTQEYPGTARNTRETKKWVQDDYAGEDVAAHSKI